MHLQCMLNLLESYWPSAVDVQSINIKDKSQRVVAMEPNQWVKITGSYSSWLLLSLDHTFHTPSLQFVLQNFRSKKFIMLHWGLHRLIRSQILNPIQNGPKRRWLDTTQRDPKVIRPDPKFSEDWRVRDSGVTEWCVLSWHQTIEFLGWVSWWSVMLVGDVLQL